LIQKLTSRFLVRLLEIGFFDKQTAKIDQRAFRLGVQFMTAFEFFLGVGVPLQRLIEDA
jgi:hypothetical protein